jgi:hypothetical protein
MVISTFGYLPLASEGEETWTHDLRQAWAICSYWASGRACLTTTARHGDSSESSYSGSRLKKQGKSMEGKDSISGRSKAELAI